MCVFESVLSASKGLLWSQQLLWFSEINLKALPGGSRCLPGINLTFHRLDLIVDNVKENFVILRTKRNPAIAPIKFFVSLKIVHIQILLKGPLVNLV